MPFVERPDGAGVVSLRALRNLASVARGRGLRATLQRSLSEADAEAFDAFVLANRSGHFSQTRAWVPVAEAVGHRTARYFLARRGDGEVVGAGVLLRGCFGPALGPVAWMERGPVCLDPDALPEVLRALRRVALLKGIARLGVMPYFADAEALSATSHLGASGFRDAQTFDGAHAVTLRFRVDKPDEAILAGRDHQTFRNELRRAERAGARARLATPGDFRDFRTMHGEMMAQQGKGGRGSAYFDALERLWRESDRAKLFVCEHDGVLVSGALVVRHGPLATLLLAATSPRACPFAKTAPPLMQAVRWARDSGVNTFDLGGVPLEGDSDPKRLAIAKFKYDLCRARVPIVREHVRNTW